MVIARSALIALAAALVAGSAPGQGPQVGGTVRDQDGIGVRGARVALGSWAGAWTDREGRFAIPIPPGRYLVSLSCPTHGGPPLSASTPPVVVVDSRVNVDLVLANGGSCLPLLENASQAEFDGVLRGSGPTQLFVLCSEPAYRVAVTIPADLFRELGRQLADNTNPTRTELALRARGRLTGPGFFGRDGTAGYLFEIETIRRFRITTPAQACPNDR